MIILFVSQSPFFSLLISFIDIHIFICKNKVERYIYRDLEEGIYIPILFECLCVRALVCVCVCYVYVRVCVYACVWAFERGKERDSS